LVAGKNQAAFDEHAQALLAKLENSDDPLWEKVAEMGRELSPDNPMYQKGAGPTATPADVDELDNLTEEPNFKADSTQEADAEGLDFDLDLSFDPAAEAEPHESAEFTPPDVGQEEQLEDETKLNLDMDSVEPDAIEQDNALEFDVEGFDMEAAQEVEEEVEGDGELADLDEVSTKLDLARAYIDMGDPDGARSILDEVMEEGSDNQKDEARDIMAQMS
jgi:pilus assembly protein FimV